MNAAHQKGIKGKKRSAFQMASTVQKAKEVDKDDLIDRNKFCLLPSQFLQTSMR